MHRVIEQRVAACGDTPALIGSGTTLTYRELNARANAVARALIGVRFKRGGHAIVSMDRSPELAVALLAVLKAGGAYSWIAAEGAPRLSAEGLGAIDLTPLLSTHVTASPNLPILTRGEDAACVLSDGRGRLSIIVPHASIVALGAGDGDQRAGKSTGSAFELWAGLMAGATLCFDELCLAEVEAA